MAKPIRVIGNPDKQRPVKWSSTVHLICENNFEYMSFTAYCV